MTLPPKMVEQAARADLDREFEMQVVAGVGSIRCVYLNDFRIAGSKPYVSEDLFLANHEKLKAEVCPLLASKLLEAEEKLDAAASWLGRWARHAGNCRGDERCTCGLVASRSEANAFLASLTQQEKESGA